MNDNDCFCTECENGFNSKELAEDTGRDPLDPQCPDCKVPLRFVNFDNGEHIRLNAYLR